jgi:hypothetical protein
MPKRKPREFPRHVYRKPWGIYFAKGGRKPYFRWRGEDSPAAFQSPEFDEWVARCKRGEGNPPKGDAPVVPPEPVNPQTFRWLCVQYYKSVDFKKRDKALLDACCLEPWQSSKPKGRKFADVPLAEINLQVLNGLRDRKWKANLPEASISRVKALRRLYRWAHSDNKIPTNPAVDLVRRKNTNPEKGHKLWPRVKIEAYENRHPLGRRRRRSRQSRTK